MQKLRLGPVARDARVSLRAFAFTAALSVTLLSIGACGGDTGAKRQVDTTAPARDFETATATSTSRAATSTPTQLPCPGTPSEQAATVVGQTVTICGVVVDASYRADVRGAPTYLNFDRAFPNHSFTAVIWGEDRSKFSTAPEVAFGPGKRVCVTGLVELYQGKPEITVDSVSDMRAC